MITEKLEKIRKNINLEINKSNSDSSATLKKWFSVECFIH